MTNPYEPTATAPTDRSPLSPPRRHVFAGLWLSLAGICHFTAINLLSGNLSFASLDWSAAFLVVLGLLVLFRFRLAMVLTRLLGSFVIVGLVLSAVLIVAGFDDDGELTYGDTSVVDPAPWQIIALLSVVALTLLPPWYALQRMFADNHAVHRSGVNAFPDG